MSLPLPIPNPRLRVAYQGEPGAFGESAIARHWGGDAEGLPVKTFDAVLAAVNTGHADRAVLPVWNSIAGDVRAALAALARAGTNVVQVDEVTIPVRQCLLALPGATTAELRVVGSHPVALAQCSAFFARNAHLTRREAYDTAGAAAQLSIAAGLTNPPTDFHARPWFGGSPTTPLHQFGAIAGETAARRWGLDVLQEGVDDDRSNRTRFLVLQRT